MLSTTNIVSAKQKKKSLYQGLSIKHSLLKKHLNLIVFQKKKERKERQKVQDAAVCSVTSLSSLRYHFFKNECLPFIWFV